MTAYLVTGGAGFIGSHLVEALVKQGDTVRVLDNLSAGTLDNLRTVQDQVEVIVGDLHDLDLVRKAAARTDVIFHEAAAGLTTEASADPGEAAFAPGADTLHVLIAAREQGVRRVVYASCASVYGEDATGTVKESEPTSPSAPAAVTKLIGEQHCLAFSSMYGLDTVRLRYFNVLGPRQSAVGPGRLLRIVQEAMLAGKAPLIPKTPGGVAWDLIYVGDVVHANLLAAELPRGAGKVFNIGRGRPTSLTQIVATLNALLGTQLEPTGAGFSPAHAEPLLADVSLAETHLGLCASIDLEHALSQCLDSYRSKHGVPSHAGLQRGRVSR